VTAVGLDAAEGMLEGARRAYPSLCWARGDAAALPFKAWSFDLVFSSSTYQWVPDLAGAFGEVRRVLKTDGRFYAALFGRATLCEFFESLEAAALIHGRHEPFSLRRLPSEEDVRLALKAAGFRHRGVVREVRSVVFQNALDLLRWLKGIGANALSPRFFLGKDLLGDLETHYGARYPLEGGIKASFEIIWLDAVK
jgi:malonyl-CoA O-methyltransferase